MATEIESVFPMSFPYEKERKRNKTKQKLHIEQMQQFKMYFYVRRENVTIEIEKDIE
jgi:hypothetical protein